MKLFWITPEFPYPANTGGRNVMWNRLKSLAQNNEVYLFSISESDEDIENVKKIEQQFKEIRLYQRNRNISTLVRSLIEPYPCLSRWNENLKSDLDDMFNDIKPDFVIVEFPQMIGILPNCIKESNRVILEQHNIEYRALRSIAVGDEPLLKKLAYRIVANQMEKYESKIYSANFIKMYTFVSREEKRFFEEKYHLTNTLLMPIGANITSFPQITHSHNILFVAKMSYQPNEDAALFLVKKVFPIIKEKIVDAKLYLVGKDPSEKLRSSINSEDIIVTGTVDNLDEYYNLADLVVVPIMSGGGVNVKLIEALGHGKFVVTTSKGIEGTDFHSNIDVFVEDDYKKFAKDCIKIFDYPENYEKIRSNGYEKIVNNYSWQKICHDFEVNLTALASKSK